MTISNPPAQVAGGGPALSSSSSKQDLGQAGRPRIYYLDALRNFAILFGLLIHAGTLGRIYPFDIVHDIDGYFRMGAFFLVQGTLPPGKGPMVWHLHLWFLIALSFYTATAPVIVTVARLMPNAIKDLPVRLSNLPSWLCITLVAAATASCSLTLRTGYELFVHPILSLISNGSTTAFRLDRHKI
jgi:hypothetical protein